MKKSPDTELMLWFSGTTSFLAVFCWLFAWLGSSFSPRHAYLFLVAGGFFAAAAALMWKRSTPLKTRIWYFLGLFMVGAFLIMYGKTQFLRGNI